MEMMREKKVRSTDPVEDGSFFHPFEMSTVHVHQARRPSSIQPDLGNKAIRKQGNKAPVV
jgi:hypothetical protein